MEWRCDCVCFGLFRVVIGVLWWGPYPWENFGSGVGHFWWQWVTSGGGGLLLGGLLRCVARGLGPRAVGYFGVGYFRVTSIIDYCALLRLTGTRIWTRMAIRMQMF